MNYFHLFHHLLLNYTVACHTKLMGNYLANLSKSFYSHYGFHHTKLFCVYDDLIYCCRNIVYCDQMILDSY
ncbi:unnamed protein product [Schistosoma curassoni]|uniref:Secreted protein n=1 Tax=Schistosoma curassoni TaxID=6186 RepID=A0A183KHD0_9TREM|nr:unnamed protein product [Schistosoma curassoni]